ncbi:MAG: hypothetical protein EBW69_03300 [Nitrosomonadales bacterium]|nr:hypothetical protein [Nitrosomonadales bacterium]
MKKIVLILIILISGCATSNLPKIEPVEKISLDNFINKIDQVIETTFTFNKGALDGPKKIYKPKGFVIPETNNAVWGMQFIWPIKAQYIIAYIDEGYENTIVARDKRDYLWFMSRSSELSTEKKQWIYKKTTELGYDKNLLRFVPHN